MIKNNFYCNNCGIRGHLYKQCHYPIISVGIISFIIINKSLYFLLVQRKDTIGYSDFIRGKYNLEKNEILNLINIMTIDEKQKIVDKSFKELWLDLWQIEDSKKEHHIEYDKCSLKHNHLLELFNINELIVESNTNFINREWGFPKGRRENLESNIDVAKREFQEETNLEKTDYELLNLNPINEDILGCDKVSYRHIYYIAKLKHENIVLSCKNKNQLLEISDIKLMILDEIKQNIRPYEINKIEIINSVVETLKFLKYIN